MSYIMRMLILALICPGFAYAQPTSEALSTVKRLLEAVRTGEAITVVNLTHPKVHELAGGREKMLSLLTGVVSEFGKNRTLSERLATRDAIVKHFVIYVILLKLA